MTRQPWTGSTIDPTEIRLNISTNAAYYLMHHPEQWELIITDGVGEWLPNFSQLLEIAGVNGVQQTPTGIDSTMARVKFMDLGFTILDQEMGYQTRYRTRSGGYYYTSVFDTPKVVGSKTFWSTDMVAYNDWRRSLITDGFINPPEPEILELLEERHQKRIERNIRLQHIPEVQQKLENLRLELDQMQDATKVLFEPVKPKKPASKKRTSKNETII
mgnify:CR=1 FL=1|tara:strand:+ start:877 stop:1524 length:648 start_codon:yes stop_codon:yes gene_type:complete